MKKTEKDLIKKTEAMVRVKFENEGSGHDWWHIYRVWQLSKVIAAKEKNVNLLVVELGALLHDIADWKFHDDEEAGMKTTQTWLRENGADPKLIDKVAHIVRHVSFKGGVATNHMESLEGKIVQDADRLDAIGAIGVARTFAFGGHISRPLYDPNISPKHYHDFETFKKTLKGNTTINHFYEKLLLLKDRMNTKTGKQMALRRHRFMEMYLKEFYSEWNGKH